MGKNNKSWYGCYLSSLGIAGEVKGRRREESGPARRALLRKFLPGSVSRREKAAVATEGLGWGLWLTAPRAQTQGKELQKFKTLDVGRLKWASDQQKKGFILATGTMWPAGLWSDFAEWSEVKACSFSSRESVKEVCGCWQFLRVCWQFLQKWQTCMRSWGPVI